MYIQGQYLSIDYRPVCFRSYFSKMINRWRNKKKKRKKKIYRSIAYNCDLFLHVNLLFSFSFFFRSVSYYSFRFSTCTNFAQQKRIVIVIVVIEVRDSLQFAKLFDLSFVFEDEINSPLRLLFVLTMRLCTFAHLSPRCVYLFNVSCFFFCCR